MLLVPPDVYARLLAYARWLRATPEWVVFNDQLCDQIGEYLENELADAGLGDDWSVGGVETGLGCGLVAVLYGPNDEEVRARIRRAGK